MRTTKNKTPIDSATDSQIRKFWFYVKKRDDGCWEWTGSRTTGGYGRSRAGDKSVYAHRLSYFLKHGSIPTDMVIDHLCRNPWCVNPDHLELVTQSQNLSRSSIHPATINANKSVCHKGHDDWRYYEHPKTFRKSRYCWVCKAEKDAERYQKSKRRRGPS